MKVRAKTFRNDFRIEATADEVDVTTKLLICCFGGSDNGTVCFICLHSLNYIFVLFHLLRNELYLFRIQGELFTQIMR